MNLRYLLFAFALLTFAACNDDDVSQHETDIALIEEYLIDNGLTAESTDSGLHYIITKEGTGDHPTVQDEITIGYKGYLLDGSVFDQNDNFTWPLSQLILGWQEGIPKLKAGGEGVLLIPSRLGYGSQALAGIPANSVLLFDVSLTSF